MSEYRKFQEIKAKYEARMAAEIQEVVKEFQEATGAPVHDVHVDILDSRFVGGGLLSRS